MTHPPLSAALLSYISFTRLQFQGSSTKRYKGGTAQQLWKWTGGAAEATPLSKDFDGTSKRPMWWKGRVYFMTDRDGAMDVLAETSPRVGELHIRVYPVSSFAGTGEPSEFRDEGGVAV